MQEKVNSSEAAQDRGLHVILPDHEPVEQGRSLVAVIGINEYAHWQKLKNAVQDAIGLLS